MSHSIAKNTAFLYGRSFVTMLISLYTSRVILDKLGVTDFGLYNLLFKGSMLYHHTLCPILAILSFAFVEKYDNLNAVKGLYFTLIYAAVMIALNVLKIVEGPYPFLLIYKQPVLHSVCGQL